MSRLERLVGELVAGSDGGWSLWLAALAALEQTVAESRLAGRERFEEFPRGELRRLLLAVEEALRRAELAVAVRDAVAGELDERAHPDRIAELLLDRARAAAAERELPASNFHLEPGY